jgi:urocanate hydratase
MSGAQPKATVICGGICVVAEINPLATRKRAEQGWVDEIFSNLDKLLERLLRAREKEEAISLVYQGNIVDLWEKLASEDISIDLGSDQTSLHNPYGGGYFPVGLSFEESNQLLAREPELFKRRVEESLRRQVTAINILTRRGMYFWDYGNAFLLEAGRAGADIFSEPGKYRYASYIQDIMGPKFFDFGFGPFRWICSSSNPKELEITDRIALETLEKIVRTAPPEIMDQLNDNIHWIREAGKNNLVVGSQARILYADSEARIRIAEAFNKAIRDGILKSPVILGRDHHDVSGTDSPYRETSDIYDGSAFTADMSVQNCIGDSFRGATWVSLHNGGGVGWGEAVNGGFGMVLDGSDAAGERLKMMLHWDTNNGISRRSWARNENAILTIKREMEKTPGLEVTLPHIPDDAIMDDIFPK